jgi:hypothetical protein
MKFRIELKTVSPELGAVTGLETKLGADMPPICRNVAQESLESVFRLETLQRSQLDVV